MEGKSLITGAKGFPDAETEFDKFFEVATKSHNGSSSAFVGMAVSSPKRMASIEGVQALNLHSDISNQSSVGTAAVNFLAPWAGGSWNAGARRRARVRTKENDGTERCFSPMVPFYTFSPHVTHFNQQTMGLPSAAFATAKRCRASALGIGAASMSSVREAFALLFSLLFEAEEKQRQQRGRVWRRQRRGRPPPPPPLSGAAAAWLPAYALMEFAYRLLDPEDPPASVKVAVLAVLAAGGVAAVAAQALSAWVAVALAAAARRRRSEPPPERAKAEEEAAADDDDDGGGKYRRRSVGGGKERRGRGTVPSAAVANVFLYSLLSCAVRGALLLWFLARLLVSMQRPHNHLAAWTLLFLCALAVVSITTSLTVPAIMVELGEGEEKAAARGTSVVVPAAVARSVKLTTQTPESFLTVPAAFTLLHSIWAVPLAAAYSRGPLPPLPALLLLPVSWTFTALNVLLSVVLHQRFTGGGGGGGGSAVAATATERKDVVPLLPSISNKNNTAVDHCSTCSMTKALGRHWKYLVAVAVTFAVFVRIRSHFFPPPVQQQQPTRTLYNPAREDWSGAQCLEMLLHHAYAYHRGRARYGGACIPDRYRNEVTAKKARERHAETRELLNKLDRATGVGKVLKFDCPAQGWDDPAVTWRFLPWLLGDWIITEDWREQLHSEIHYPPKDPGVFKIVAHIRRGDIKPCTGDKMHKYLPNSYFLDMIDRYMPLSKRPEHVHKRVEVVIHSQEFSWEAPGSRSFESTDEFRRRNYTVKLEGTPLDEAWLEMMTADVFIMSQSGFSVVPALLNRDGVVVFAPYFFFERAPGWEFIGWKELRRYKEQVQEMERQCGKPKGGTPRKRKRAGGKSGVMFFLQNLGTKNGFKYFIPN